MHVDPAASQRCHRARRSVLSTLSCVLFGVVALSAAEAIAQVADPRLSADVLATVWPGAERIGDWAGEPPAAPVYQGEDVVGYIYSTLDVVARRGYSNAPFDVIGGVDLAGDLKAAKVITHTEPHIMHDDARARKLDKLLASFLNQPSRGGRLLAMRPDFVSGATISARAMRSATLESAIFVLRGRSAQPVVSEPTLDIDTFRPTAWKKLLNDGSVAKTVITNRALSAALAKDVGTDIKAFDQFGPADEPYLEVYTSLVTPAGIGRNLFGLPNFERYREKWNQNGHQIFLGVKGDYDFRGTAWWKRANNYVLDRLRVVQGDTIIRFNRDHHELSGPYQRRGLQRGEGVKSLNMMSVLHVPGNSDFDPLQPWQFVLTVHHEDDEVSADVDFTLAYQIPINHVLMPEPEPVPAWVEAWQDARTNVGVMGTTLATLTIILAFQGPLTRRRRLHRWVRNGFLLFVLVWVGWIAGAQLSIVNIFNFVTAPLSGFEWGPYLADPLIFMIAAYTAVSLILLGRGVFCGWLCPFGAMQEILGQIGRALKLPQWSPVPRADRWLRSIKYVLATGLIALALYSIELATTLSEVEPFMTAITSAFVRPAPYVAYAALLLGASLFVERFFCRFACPLGGMLAILGRFHIFNALKRRSECGSQCHLCELSCPVQAIEKTGKINMNECFQCLDCQVEYYDDKRCPPLAKIRKQFGRGLDGDPSGQAPVAPEPMHPLKA